MSVSLKSSSGDSKRSNLSNASKHAGNTKQSSSSKSSSKTQESAEQPEEHVQPEFPESNFKSILASARARKKPTLDEFKRGTIEKTTLFSKTMTLDSAEVLFEKKSEEPSILVTGFGLRNLRSLQDALEEDEQKRLLELYKYQKPIVEEHVLKEEADTLKHSISSGSSTTTRDISTKSAETETELTTAHSDISGQKLQLHYLMGLQHQAIEEHTEESPYQSRDQPDFVYSNSIPMQQAQRYLRVHRIFDFFQFITAHLLGSLPANPVEFIIELLNKCLLYRSGLGKPPLLYDETHILQLFKLMDRMNTGFIEKDQYKQGLITLGVCEYNKFPQMTADNMVSKETFIEEAMRGELCLFNDLIRERRTRKVVMQDELQKASVDVLSKDSAGPYFMPSELFRSLKKEQKPGGKKSAPMSYFGEG
ncbi:unnamed protein product [Phaedon cochleariae]|uniref:EF-hand domain-containing protein n=1 Tax=Phaedon cochleariae TaxID=80249 RepID=A0A9P0D863_PHACE|nr:unnamed protein product [Phaedon cochleariae]